MIVLKHCFRGVVEGKNEVLFGLDTGEVSRPDRVYVFLCNRPNLPLSYVEGKQRVELLLKAEASEQDYLFVVHLLSAHAVHFWHLVNLDHLPRLILCCQMASRFD